MCFTNVTLTVHLVICDHSVAHLFCGKNTFSLGLMQTILSIIYYTRAPICMFMLYILLSASTFHQMKVRSYLSMVPTMDVVT